MTFVLFNSLEEKNVYYFFSINFLWKRAQLFAISDFPEKAKFVKMAHTNIMHTYPAI